jgi:hypothetical protein
MWGMKEPTIMQGNPLCSNEEQNKTEPTSLAGSLDKGNLKLTPSLLKGVVGTRMEENIHQVSGGGGWWIRISY